MPVLLVIDDDANVLKCFKLAFHSDDIDVRTARTGEVGTTEFRSRRPDAVVCDIRLPDVSGLDLLAQLRQIDQKVPIVLMTGHGTAETAIQAMRRGAFDYLLKPIDLDALEEVVGRAFEVGRLMRVPPKVVASDEPTDDQVELFVGNDPAMQEVFKTIGLVASTNAPVLILGETGTGKEMVARAIYHNSRRAEAPFLAVNCAAIPEALLESDLFGHEKGSFTGADRRRIGKFEQCHGGTLFLDEIGDMTPLTQAKILRVLQDQRFERVGGTESIQTDVRLVAATNRNLESMMADGDFREDLFYRLNVCTIRLPLLRERPTDIPLLVRHFLRLYGGAFDKEVSTVEPAAMRHLQDFPWPGNVRQLQSVIKQALLRVVGPTLVASCLPAEVLDKSPTDDAAAGPLTIGTLQNYARERIRDGSTDLYAEVIGRVERELLSDVLTHTRGNLTQAAIILGITRPTLRAKLAHHSISMETKLKVTHPA